MVDTEIRGKLKETYQEDGIFMGSKSYDKAFKLNAVELYKNGKSPIDVCADLDIPDSTFWGWVKKYNDSDGTSFGSSTKIKSDDEDIVALKKKLADVQMERDILKKAVAIFSKHRQ